MMTVNGFRQLDSGSLRTDYENLKVLVSYFFYFIVLGNKK
jgi:hypothetical protein